MTYLPEQAGDEIQIRPVMPYLDKIAAGGPIEPLRYTTPTCCPFEWKLPALDFTLLNRTPVTFLLSEAVFEMEESRLDPTPVIVVKEDVIIHCGFVLARERGPYPARRCCCSV